MFYAALILILPILLLEITGAIKEKADLVVTLQASSAFVLFGDGGGDGQ